MHWVKWDKIVLHVLEFSQKNDHMAVALILISALHVHCL